MPTIKAQLAPLRAASPSPAKPAATTASKSRAMTVPAVPVITTAPKASAAWVIPRPTTKFQFDPVAAMIELMTESPAIQKNQFAPERRVVATCPLLGDEAIADPGNGVDVVRLLGVALDLLAQPVDVGIDGAGLDLDLVTPDLAQQLTATDHLAGLRGQQGEEIELGQGEGEFLFSRQTLRLLVTMTEPEEPKR